MAEHFATCLMVSSIMTSIGGIIKYVAGSSYTVAIIGQFIIALAQGCLMSAPAGKKSLLSLEKTDDL